MNIKFFLLILVAATSFIANSWASTKPIHVIVWSEGGEPKSIYPTGINETIAEFLKGQPNLNFTISNLNQPKAGISEELLNKADVLIWFGHKKHEAVPDHLAVQIVNRVHKGMGFIALHSSHFSKPFKLLLNTSGAWQDYQEVDEPEHMHVLLSQHPIVQGVTDFTLGKSERYVEPFQVPHPDSVIVEGIWDNGQHNREVMTWTVGKGRMVYIAAGHEQYPIYHNPQMQRLITNAAYWAAGVNPSVKTE